MKDWQTKDNPDARECPDGFLATDKLNKPFGIFKLATILEQNLYHRVTALFIKSHKNKLVVNSKNYLLTFPLITPVPYKYSPVECCQLFLSNKLNLNPARITKIENIDPDDHKNFAFINIYLAYIDNITTLNIPVYQDTMHDENLKINPDPDLMLVDQDELAALQRYGMDIDPLFKKIWQKIFAD